LQKLYPYRLYFLIAFSVLVYSHTLFHDFVFDDDIVLVKNQHVINGTEGIAKIWSTNYLNGYQQFNDALYRPLSPTVFNMVHSIAGLNPHAFHLVNILVYALLVFIVYKLFNQLFPRKEKYVFWGVLLFAVHPIHTEVVANIKSLDELLALLLGASASYYILLYKSGKNTLVQVFILYVLALFSKESAISFLLIIPLFYYFTEGKISYKKLGFLSLGLLTLTISWYLLHEYIINSMPREVDKGIFSASSNSIIYNGFMAGKQILFKTNCTLATF